MKVTIRIEYVESFISTLERKFSTVELKTWKGRLTYFWYNLKFILFDKTAHEQLINKLRVLRQLRELNITLEDSEIEYLSRRWRNK